MAVENDPKLVLMLSKATLQGRASLGTSTLFAASYPQSAL